MAKGDRRTAPRSPTALKVEYPEQLDYLADWTTNVSARGFFIATDNPFSIGEELHTRITFPGVEEPENLEAVVVWRKPATEDEPAGVGVRLATASQQHVLTSLAYKALKRSDADSFHIVAVDDELDVLDLYAQVVAMLQKRDGPAIRFSTATDGVAALNMIEREGADLSCNVPLTFSSAALGGEVKVPTLAGEVSLKIPAGTQSGRVFRLRGKGVKPVRGGGPGELYCRVDVETPTSLTKEQKKLLRDLEASLDAGGDQHSPRQHGWKDTVKQFFDSL